MFRIRIHYYTDPDPGPNVSLMEPDPASLQILAAFLMQFRAECRSGSESEMLLYTLTFKTLSLRLYTFMYITH